VNKLCIFTICHKILLKQTYVTVIQNADGRNIGVKKMKFTKLAFGAALVTASYLSMAAAASALTLSNGLATSGDIAPFGNPDTKTYGQVFTAPVTGILTDFTLYLNDSVGGDLFGALGSWNGTAAYGFGFGVNSLLYTSANVTSTPGFSAYTFSPNISVTAGSLFVAYLSTFGTNATTSTTMPLASNLVTDIDYFVWNNTSNPNNGSWNYFFDTGSVLFTANFKPVSAVPVPAALPLLLTGLGGIVTAARSRRRKQKAA
jgi:hypothetical protein